MNEATFAPAIRIAVDNGYPNKPIGFAIFVGGKTVATFSYKQWEEAKESFDALAAFSSAREERG